jgi:hypothetical protein
MAWKSWKSARSEQKLLLIGTSAAYCVLLLLAARAVDLKEPYLPFAIAGGFIFYLLAQPKFPDLISPIIFSAGFALVVRFPDTKGPITDTASIACLLGFGAFLMLGLRWIWSAPLERRQTIALFTPASALVFFVFAAQHALNLANLLHPTTYDLYLYAADGAFGFQPSFLFGRAMAASYVLRITCLLAYFSLPLVMALGCALCLPRNPARPSWDLVSLLMLTGLGGWAVYNVLPATGPLYVFGASFPSHPLPYDWLPKLLLGKVPVPSDVPRNAIPSLHMAWLWLLYWNTKRSAWSCRMFLTIYLGLTVVATLGTGEHYLVDLITALPFALMIQAVVSPGNKPRLLQRVLAGSCGMVLTLGWLSLVRYGVKILLVSPAVPWALLVLTCYAVCKTYPWPSSLPHQPQPEVSRSHLAAEKVLAF